MLHVVTHSGLSRDRSHVKALMGLACSVHLLTWTQSGPALGRSHGSHDAAAVNIARECVLKICFIGLRQP